MKKLLVFSAFLCSMFYVANAQTVSVDDALLKATSLRTSIRHKAPAQGVETQPKLVYTKEDKGSPLFYVFNYPSGGFAIIGGDEAANDILGYSEKGEFDITRIPEGLKDMLAAYGEQISYAIANPLVASTSSKHRKAAKIRTAIPELMKTKWGQNEPFNSSIPTLGSGYSKFVTGCNATAAAQVMKFYNYPTKGTGSHSYTVNYNGTIPVTFSANYAGTTYDWANMLVDYSDDYSNAQGNAVATLLYHVGVGMDMSYNSGGSSSSSTAPGTCLTQYFGYSKSARYESRDYYTDDDWEDLIYNELATGHPIVYGGQSNEGGHAFVCHGYDASKGGYAINWGWDGYCDGYFPLTGTGALLPAGTGTGGSSAGSAYTKDQSAFIGLVPDPEGDDVQSIQIALTSPMPFANGSYSNTVNISGSTTKVNMTGTAFHNIGFMATSFRYGVVLKETTTGRMCYFDCTEYDCNLNAGSSYTGNPFVMSFDAKEIIYNGTYKVIPVFCLNDGSVNRDWQIGYQVPSNAIPELTITGGKSAEPVDIAFTIRDNTIQVGKTTTISAPAGYAGSVTFTSSDPSVATVSSTGVVTGVKTGTATITVNGDATSLFNATKKQFTVTVVDRVWLTPEFTISANNMYVGGSLNITCSAGYDGTPTYKSSNNAIATVDANGKVVAISAGTVTITATAPATDTYKAVEKQFTITVLAALPSALCFSEMPKFTNGDILVPGGMKFSFVLKNNSSQTITNPTFYFKMELDNGYADYEDDFAFNGTMEVNVSWNCSSDFTGFEDCFVSGKSYSMYFYYDQAMTKPMNIPSFTFTYYDKLPGDADGDGKITVSDVTKLKELLINKASVSNGADVNGDGKVTIIDIVKLIDKLNK